MAITWERFSAYNEDSKASFESLSSIIFCDIVGALIKTAPINYPGLEARPVIGKDGRTYGYQCKFFQGNNSREKQQQIDHSLKRIKDDDLAVLDVVYIFANTCSDGVEKKCETTWNRHLKSKGIKPIKLEWRYGIDFYFNHLNDSKFEGVMSMYFGSGRPLKLLGSNLNQNFLEVRLKKYYLDIPLLYKNKRTTITHLASNKSPVILIQSRAGTGKSWLLCELAYKLGSIEAPHKKRLIDVYKNGITILLTAHECRKDSINNILTKHLSNYGITPFDCPITILLDAIDEVERESAQQISESISKLLRSGQIKRVIITSRTASINSNLVSSLLNPTIYDVDSLSDDELVNYFRNRRQAGKTKILREALKNKINVEPIRNIRMLETVWAVINEVQDFSLETIFQKSYENEIAKLQLSNLNILEPVSEEIEFILHEQAYRLQQREAFDFSLNEIQDIILHKLPRINYRDVNEIISVLKKVCLDSTSIQSKRLQFSNRSWVDYFTARHLALEYSNRKLSSILEFSAYEDFINTWFIPVARKQFIEQGKTVDSIALGVIQYYSNDEYSLSWIDKKAELMTDIAYAKYNPSIAESVSSYVRNTKDLKIIRRAYESGMRLPASSSFHRIKDKLASSKKVPRHIWDDIVEYWYLRVIIDQMDPLDALDEMQSIIEINIDKSSKASHVDESDFASKLVKLSNMLASLGVDNKKIITSIKPDLVKYFFEFIVRPENIFAIRKDAELSSKLLGSLGTEEELSLYIKGLLLDAWDNDEIKMANELLEKINESSSSSYFHPLAYNVKRLSLLRILSLWKLDEKTYLDGPLHHTLTLSHIFNTLYGLFAFTDWHAQLGKFTGWLNSEGFYYYEDNRNYSNQLRIAIGDVLTGVVKTVLPVQLSADLVRSMEQDGKKIYAPYHLLLNIYQHDERKFRGIFTYSDVLKILKSSRDDVASRQSATSDFALIIGMYNSDDLLLFATNSKRDARLRYGYRKDIIGFFLTDALEVLWRDGIYGLQELKEYTWRVYKIILRILEITDGSETHWLPNYMFEVLCKYDLNFAEEVYVKFTKDYDYDSDSVRTILIRGAISRGDSYQAIKSKIRQYRPSMLEPGRVVPTYYEEQIVCLGDVLLSDKYTLEEKTDAIKDMSNCLYRLKTEAKSTRWSYRPSEFSDKLNEAAKIYRTYKKKLIDINDLETFPYPHRQKDSFSHEYEKKQIDAGAKARDALEKSQNQNDIINVIDNYIDYGYKYLLKTDAGSSLFVKKLEQFRVPFEKVKPIINRAIDEYYYGEQSKLFVRAMWVSSYRNDMLNTFANSMHHSDLKTILLLYSEDGDKNSVRNLIDQVTSIIELLTREDLEDRAD